MTIQEANQQLESSLRTIYEEREAAAITGLVMEKITGLKKIDRILNKASPISSIAVPLLKEYTGSLLNHKPVQYVLHEAWFYSMKLYVDERVLIPRPETEELVEWLIQDVKNNSYGRSGGKQSILDMGTGSGCISIALKKKLPEQEIFACDISRDALDVAKRNATEHEVSIQFRQLDFLDSRDRNLLPDFDYIISNPPYIPLRDRKNMEKNVVNHEPHPALFVVDDDPLIFYEAIADFAIKKLSPAGKIFAELHEDLADQAKTLFSEKGFQAVEIKKDVQGKNRMIKATRLL